MPDDADRFIRYAEDRFRRGAPIRPTPTYPCARQFGLTKTMRRKSPLAFQTVSNAERGTAWVAILNPPGIVVAQAPHRSTIRVPAERCPIPLPLEFDGGRAQHPPGRLMLAPLSRQPNINRWGAPLRQTRARSISALRAWAPKVNRSHINPRSRISQDAFEPSPSVSSGIVHRLQAPPSDFKRLLQDSPHLRVRI